MAGRYYEGKIKMASEKVSRKMVLEIRYVNANNAVIHTENLVTGILAKISLGTGIWAKFRLGTGIWYPPSRPSTENELCRKQRNNKKTLSWLPRKFVYCCAFNHSFVQNIFFNEGYFYSRNFQKYSRTSVENSRISFTLKSKKAFVRFDMARDEDILRLYRSPGRFAALNALSAR